MPKGIPKNGINKGWFDKNNHPKTEFKKGHLSTHTIEGDKKQSDTTKGHKCYNKGGYKVKDTSKMGVPKGCLSPMKGKKHSEEAKEKNRQAHLGEKSYLWIDGRTAKNNPYAVDWTESLRRTIRERDRYTCQICGKPQGDIAHPVHHKDYDKENCNPDNLVTLCRKCHSKTNFNRNYWLNYFNIKL